MRATPRGTFDYTHRFDDACPGWFRVSKPLGLSLSSVAAGTRRGPMHDGADAAYAESVTAALHHGCNVIVTAASDRHRRSERAVATALHRAGIPRDQLVIVSQGGQIAFDGVVRRDVWAWFDEVVVDRGLAWPEDLLAGRVCLAPGFLQDQFDGSRAALGLDVLDLYLIQQPESLWIDGDPSAADAAWEAVVVWAEAQCAAGTLGAYGVAFGTAEAAVEYSPRLLTVAESVAGSAHHLRTVALPLGLGRDEWARGSAGAGPWTASLTERGVDVWAGAPLDGGRLLGAMGDEVIERLGVQTAAQAGLQFARSLPGVTTVVTGMRAVTHVGENLALRSVPPLTPVGHVCHADCGHSASAGPDRSGESNHGRLV